MGGDPPSASAGGCGRSVSCDRRFPQPPPSRDAAFRRVAIPPERHTGAPPPGRRQLEGVGAGLLGIRGLSQGFRNTRREVRATCFKMLQQRKHKRSLHSAVPPPGTGLCSSVPSRRSRLLGPTRTHATPPLPRAGAEGPAASANGTALLMIGRAMSPVRPADPQHSLGGCVRFLAPELMLRVQGPPGQGQSCIGSLKISAGCDPRDLLTVPSTLEFHSRGCQPALPPLRSPQHRRRQRRAKADTFAQAGRASEVLSAPGLAEGQPPSEGRGRRRERRAPGPQPLGHPGRRVGADVPGAGGRPAKSGLGSLVEASAGRPLPISLLSSPALRWRLSRGWSGEPPPRKQVRWKRRRLSSTSASSALSGGSWGHFFALRLATVSHSAV